MTLPQHLSSREATGLHQGELIAQFEISSARNFVYLILDWQTKNAAWVDPQKDLRPPLDALEKNGFKLTAILLTHSHWDHVAGVPELIKKFPGIPVHVHPQDQKRLDGAPYESANFQDALDGSKILVGKLALDILHTPGHSAGECSYFLPATSSTRPYLFTGDTVFIRDCGRTDFEDGSNEQMFASLQRIKKLPKETVILPGHHYAKETATTIEQEMAESPPFRCGSVQELASLP